MASTGISNKKKELKNLYFLQLINKELEANEKLKGDIPNEIERIESTLQKNTENLNNLLEEEKNTSSEIKNEKITIEECESLIQKYEKQQKSVRNNKEFESLEREIEYQKLEIELSNKNLQKHAQSLENIETKKSALLLQIDEEKEFLNEKKEALNKISQKTDKKTNALKELLEANEKKIKDPKLLKIYQKRQKKGANIIATINRDASTASNILVPTAAKGILNVSENDVVLDEYSGCFLIDLISAEEIEKKAEKEFKKLT